MADLAYREVHAMSRIEARLRLVATYDETGSTSAIRLSLSGRACRISQALCDWAYVGGRPADLSVGRQYPAQSLSMEALA